MFFRASHVFRVTATVLLNGNRHPEKRRRSAVQDLPKRAEIELFLWYVMCGRRS